MKVAIIVPYFGTLPNYFQLFLDSCESNRKFEWLIFSDDTTRFHYPKNVHFTKMSFQECRELVQSKFEFKIELMQPQKLCDYKCAYGLIFENFLDKYDWWGHCDLDQIFGDLDAFVTDEMLNNYDRIGSLGHLTLYRNTVENSQEFKRTLNNRKRYREVFTTSKGCAFDEWLPDNVNDLYIQSGRPIILDNFGADINPYRTQFSLIKFDIAEHQYVKSNIKNSIFMVENGKLLQIYSEGHQLKKVEYPYVHLQKRKMKDKRSDLSSKDYYIVPNSFVDKKKEPMKVLAKSKKWRLLNYQYFKVKTQSFKYRMRNSDWQFTNIFRN